MTSYEQQLSLAEKLRRPVGDNDRFIDWGDTGELIGLARTPKGQIEIFLAGDELRAHRARVREALEHQRWFRAGGDQLLANRLLLPAAGHFTQVAAFLTAELLRNGATDDLPAAFARTEPIIELAIENLLLADEPFLGLCGEMLALNALLRAAADDEVSAIVEAWKGHDESARDFQVASVGVEVKTTLGQTSSHLFRGVHQLEIGHGVDGVEETAFMVLSIGLEWADDEDPDATTLPVLVDAVIERLSRSFGASAQEAIDEFLAQCASYGSATLGYDHRTMSASPRFARRLRVAFARGYDLSDDAIRLLTTDDLRARPMIDAGSLHMRVNLPNRVRGDVNPVVGLTRSAEEVLRLAKGLSGG